MHGSGGDLVIREAVVGDIPALIEMGREWHEKSCYRDVISYDPESCAATFEGLISADYGVVFIGEGMLGGIVTPHFINRDFLIALEMFWTGKDGVELHRAFEAWAEDRGAHLVTMTGLCDEREQGIRRLYRSRGYRPGELTFWKGL